MTRKSSDFVFIHVPKTGGMAVSAMIRKVNPAFRDTHDTVRDYQRLYGLDYFSSMPGYALIRNPYDHLLSAFCYGRERFDRTGSADVELLHSFRSFTHFCHTLPENIVRLRKMAMFRPQSSFVQAMDGSIPVECWPFDRLEPFCAMLKEKHLRTETELRLVNRSNHRHHADIYSQRMRTLVREYFRSDFELYESIRAEF